jgi:uncharacterized protein (TIGR03437 family)
MHLHIRTTCMRPAVLWFAALVFVDIGLAQSASTVIFNSFGLGDSYNYLSADAINPPSLGYTVASSFAVSGSNFRLDSIEIAMAGYYPVDIALMNDEGGLPGSVLEAYHISSMANPYSTNNPPITLLSQTHPALADGGQYWLRMALSPSATFEQSWWNIRTTPTSGQTASQFPFTNNGNWTINGPGGTAFKIVGDEIPISVSGTSLVFTTTAGGSFPAAQTVQISGSSTGLSFTAQPSSTSWLSVSPTSGFTPSSLSVTVNPSNLSVGTYRGSITVSGGIGDPSPTAIQVMLVITVPVPQITAVVNAASDTSGAISPGEIVAIGGIAIGPGAPVGLMLDQTGKVATNVAGVQVLFSGTPAPLIYVSSSQINAIVPYEVQGLLNPSVQVNYQGQTSNAFPLTPTTATPAFFTSNSSGTGPAAALNQNLTYNTSVNPAAKGSYVVLYVTGEGQTAPPGVTGEITTVSATAPLTPQPILPVTVSINGQSAFVAFYGEAPGLVSGVMQLNVQIPTSVPSGTLPISVSVGGIASRNNVTISVE